MAVDISNGAIVPFIAPPPHIPLHPSPECPPNHDVVNLVISIIMTVGLVISYLPQHVKIISHRSSEGLSPWYLFLGGISVASTVINLFVLQIPLVRCCSEWDGATCAENMLGIIQVSLQFISFYLIIVLFVMYFPSSMKYVISSHSTHLVVQPSSASLPVPSESQHASWFHLRTHIAKLTGEYKTALFVLMFVTLYFAICACIAVSFISLPVGEETRIALAAVLGFISTIMTMFQFTPQIYRTWRLKHVGSLSIPMMCIQTPGTVIFVWSLSLRDHTNITTYLSYIIAMLSQAILLTLAIYYSFFRKDSRGEYAPISQAGDEENPPPPYAASRECSGNSRQVSEGQQLSQPDLTPKTAAADVGVTQTRQGLQQTDSSKRRDVELHCTIDADDSRIEKREYAKTPYPHSTSDTMDSDNGQDDMSLLRSPTEGHATVVNITETVHEHSADLLGKVADVEVVAESDNAVDIADPQAVNGTKPKEVLENHSEMEHAYDVQEVQAVQVTGPAETEAPTVPSPSGKAHIEDTDAQPDVNHPSTAIETAPPDPASAAVTSVSVESFADEPKPLSKSSSSIARLTTDASMASLDSQATAESSQTVDNESDENGDVTSPTSNGNGEKSPTSQKKHRSKKGGKKGKKGGSRSKRGGRR